MLSTLQHNWVQALYQRDVMPAYITGARNKKRFEIYRASLLSNLVNALADVYPVVQKLVGATFFSAMARKYIVAHESQNGDIHYYGENFAEFVRDFPPAQSLVYLADMAQLEWRLHTVFHAADVQALSIQQLAQLTTDSLACDEFFLRPDLQCLESNYPLQRIWQANQNNAESEEINLAAGADCLLVYRQGLETVLISVEPIEFTFIKTLQQNQNLMHSCDHILQQQPDFDLAVMLHKLFEWQMVTALPKTEELQ